VRLLASRPTPNLEDQDIFLRLAPTPWPVRHGCPYATAGIALRVSGALKPHHDKVQTPSVETREITEIVFSIIIKQSFLAPESIHLYVYKYINSIKL
jgi:hypothetical protein